MLPNKPFESSKQELGWMQKWYNHFYGGISFTTKNARHEGRMILKKSMIQKHENKIRLVGLEKLEMGRKKIPVVSPNSEKRDP